MLVSPFLYFIITSYEKKKSNHNHAEKEDKGLERNGDNWPIAIGSFYIDVVLIPTENMW